MRASWRLRRAAIKAAARRTSLQSPADQLCGEPLTAALQTFLASRSDNCGSLARCCVMQPFICAFWSVVAPESGAACDEEDGAVVVVPGSSVVGAMLEGDGCCDDGGGVCAAATPPASSAIRARAVDTRFIGSS